ncbi:MAG: SAM hydroxide adenosyltransferase [Candidatus Dojkabacteria bacterium]
MFITIINDCASANDINRQTTRYATLFPEVSIGFVPIANDLGNSATIQAAGNLIDALDAAINLPEELIDLSSSSNEKGKARGLIAVNVAPRGEKERWANGSPFCFFWLEDILVVSTIEGYTLSLLNKLGLIDKVHVAYLEENCRDERIRNTQFRSFEYVPLLSKWLTTGREVKATELILEEANLPDPSNKVWWIDNWGNCKTTITARALNRKAGEKVKTSLGEINYYERLKDVPKGELALVEGSSGYKDQRFVEIVLQKGSAAKKLRLDTGYLLEVLD